MLEVLLGHDLLRTEVSEKRCGLGERTGLSAVVLCLSFGSKGRVGEEVERDVSRLELVGDALQSKMLALVLESKNKESLTIVG
jgi:hypothetical protein